MIAPYAPSMDAGDITKRVSRALCKSRAETQRRGHEPDPDIEEYVRAEAEFGIFAIIWDMMAWGVNHPADLKAKKDSARDHSFLPRWVKGLRKRLGDYRQAYAAAGAGTLAMAKGGAVDTGERRG